MTSILYVTYDGLLEPLGQSQVVAYVERMAAHHRFHILSFEKTADRQDQAALSSLRSRLEAVGVGWTPLTYHKRPTAPATAFDICVGTLKGLEVIRQQQVEIVHARSYVAAAIANNLKRLAGTQFLFDMRGFWADERVDGGLWRRDGQLYRLAKQFEDIFLRRADHVVALTRAAAKALKEFPALTDREVPLTVIPTCADLDRFSPGPSPNGPFTLGQVGSVGTWYLFPQVLALFKILLVRRPDARLLVVNRGSHDLIRAQVAEAGIPQEKLELLASAHADVPRHIRRMHAGVTLNRPAFSKIASAPTRLAEYLGCGKPAVGNDGVGDVHEVLEGNGVGVSLADFSPPSLERAVDRIVALAADPSIAARCRDTAERLFSLDLGVERYLGVYDSLLSGQPSGRRPA
ncbi:glycosyltransferase [Thermaurantiacus sp.]